MHSELKNLKKNLFLNCQLKEDFREPSKEYIEEKWKEITSNFMSILKEGKSNQVFQELYNEINDLLLYEVSTSTIDYIENILKNYSSDIKNKIEEIIKLDKEKFYENFNNLWYNVVHNFNLLGKIANRYENKVYGNNQKNTIYTKFLNFLNSNLINSDLYTSNFIINRTIEEINNFRRKIINKEITYNKENIVQNLSKIKYVINFLSETGLYNEYFNKNYLSESKKFYEENSLKQIQESNLDEYIAYINIIFPLENTIIMEYLNQISLKPLLNDLNNILLKDKIKIIFNKFFNSQNDNIIFSENFELMKKIFLLFKEIKIESEIKKYFNDYIQKCSNKIYELYSLNYLELYNHLTLLKTNINNFISISFLNEESFKSLMKKNLTQTLNIKQNFITDVFSRYIEHLLIETAKKETIDKLKENINEFIILFKYIENKDMFEHYFIKRFANICLYNLNVSEELQNYLIERLKKECGNFFVSKSEEMISDVKLSKELNDNFIEQSTLLKDNNIIFNFSIYSNYSWPISKIIIGNINDNITSIQNEFYNFYKKKNPGKTVKWHLPYCSSEIEFNGLENKNYIIKANGIHTLILYNFKKSKKELTINDIVSLTNLDKEILKEHLNDIINYKILIYDSEKDIYSFNDNFQNEENEINLINFNKEKNLFIENEKIEKKTIIDRKPVCDCYLMRTLKSKKIMNKDDLIEEVYQKLPYQSDKEFIQKRLEQLINNKYISIDGNDENVVRYC